MYNDFLSKINVPFDEIAIPSKGLFYENKQNSFIVKYLTSKEESVLTSPTLTESGKAIEIVLSSSILNWNYDFKDILVGDKNAVLLYLRSTSYGDEFKFNYTCSNCKKETEGSVRLSSLESKEIEEMPDENGEYTFILPKMTLKSNLDGELKKVSIKFKPKTIGDEIKIKKIENDEKIVVGDYQIKKTAEATYRVLITSVNDVKDEDFIRNIIKRMSMLDSEALKKYMNKVEPGVDTNFKCFCQNCNYESNNNFPIDTNFFGYPDDYRQNLMDEIFLISYYSQGGITRQDAVEMPVYERRWTMQRISEEVDKKNQAEKAAVSKAKKSGK